jgi:DNA-binding transcriptional ArsR family regulator
MTIQSNSRQVPKVRMYTANKMYYDLLYGVLQEMSYYDFDLWGERRRYIDKCNIKYVDLAERIGLTRQSVSSKFKNLIELGLIEYEEEEKRYVLNSLDKNEAALIPFETLRRLNNTVNHNCISIYVYLLNRFVAAEQKEYMITLGQLKMFIGLSDTTNSNNVVVTDILVVLRKLGLVDFRKESNGSKTYFVIEKVRNVIED